MKAVKWIYKVAGIYGLLVIVPMFFAENRIAIVDPPAITHPEFFYGFLCLCTVFQLLFLLISKDPIRYRPLIPLAILEKIPYGILIIFLFSNQRVSGMVLIGGLIDLFLSSLFIWSFFKTKELSF